MIWSKFRLAGARGQSAAKGRRSSLAGLGLLAVCLLLGGCGFYSFTGTNIDPTVRTFSVQTVPNNAPTAPAYISQRFTEDLKDYFQRNTSLKLVPRDGDLQFDGTIIAYDYSPAAIQKVDGVDRAGSNRLTIQVKMRFTNLRSEQQSFDQTFQSFFDFPATQDVSSINNDQTSIRRITSNIISDIFNKSVANW